MGDGKVSKVKRVVIVGCLVFIGAAPEIKYPDSTLTPGVAADVTEKEICVKGYSKKARNVPAALKRQVYEEYGAHKEAGKCCEVDHLISLELGGSNALENLWPQPYPQAHWKDKIENRLHRDICSGKITMEQAQQQIVDDWYAVYLEESK